MKTYTVRELFRIKEHINGLLEHMEVLSAHSIADLNKVRNLIDLELENREGI